MKRTFLILAIVALIVFCALFLLRHVIVGHAFKVGINKKTNETIAFNIGDVHYDVMGSSVSFTDSEFSFSDVYLNKEKTIELSELKFDEIKIVGLSFFRLIFKREIVAERFIVAKPSLWFLENQNPVPFKEKPKEIIKSLKEHPDILGNLTIIVDEIEIANGMVDLNSLINAEEHNGSVEFKLLLKNFNTSKEDVFEGDRVLFAEEHFVKLSNFNYTLPNGDKIGFDSTVFKSNSNKLIFSNIKVGMNSGSIHAQYNPITAQVREILIEGIGFEAIENLHWIDVDSIAISDVHLCLTKNDSVVPITTSDTSAHKRDLFKLIHSLELGSFTLNNVNVLNRGTGGDTIINVENLNFSVSGIHLDSASLANKIPDIDYGSINVSSGAFKMFGEKSGLEIMLNDFLFDEKTGIVSLAGLQVNDHGDGGSTSFTTGAGAIEVSGVSAEDFVKGNPMKLGLAISDPIIDIDLHKASQHDGTKKKADLGNFEITEVIISNGSVHLFENNELDVSVVGLDFNSGKIQIDDFSKIHEVNTDGLVLNTSSVKIHMQDKDISVTSSSMSILKNTFNINDISTHIDDNDKINTSIFVDQLQLGGIDIGEIIADREINLEYVNVIGPQIDGSLNSASGKNKSLHKQPSQKPSYKINIDDFELMRGKVDLGIDLKNDAVKIKSGIDIIVDNIEVAGNNDTAWLDRLLWNVNLSQPVIHYRDYSIRCKKIESDNAKELMLLTDIQIHDNANSKLKSGVDIRELSIGSVELSGLEYNTIIDKQTPVVRAISIENPYFDLRIDSRNQQPKDSANGKKTKFSIPFEVDELEIDHLSFRIEKHDSISVSNFSLGNLDIKYDMTAENNVVDGLDYFSATDFLFSDTIKNSFADVKKLGFSKQESRLTISGINGGNINKENGENHLSYASSGFDISGIGITQTIPHDVVVKEIDIDDFNLNIESHKATGATSGSPSEKKMGLPSFMGSLGIDIISANNIDINHVTVTDTSVKKLALTDIGFLIDSLKIDSSSFEDDNIMFAEQISISLNGNKFISKDSLYETSANSISYDFSENALTVDTLMMKPRYKPAEFFKKAVYQTGKMDIVAGKIVCNDFRLKKLVADGSIHIGGIDVNGLDMRIYRNKKYEMNPDYVKKMPQEALLGVLRTLTIDSLKTHGSYIQYRQLSKKSVVPGEIFLNEVNLSVFNISNDLKVVDETSSMVAIFKAKLLGESAMDLKLTLPILSPAHDFWVTGHIDNIDFTKLNSMTQNLVGVTLERGTGELDIPLISGNSQHSEGSILFKYRKLKIDLYDRDKAENASGLGGSMANLLLNDIFIKSNNPGFLGRTRPGEVYFKRNVQKSIVFYTWKSVLSGIMSTMGYNNKEQRQEKRAWRRKRKG